MATTTAVAVPLSTLVPMKQVFLSSVGEAAARSFGVVELLDRERFAGEAALADEEVFGGQAPARRPGSCRPRRA